MPRRRLAAAGAAGVVVLASGTALGGRASGGRPPSAPPTRSAARPAVTYTSGGSLPADCVPSPVAPPYQLGLTVTISGGVLSDGPVSVRGLSARLCGVVTVAAVPPCPASGVAAVPADGQVFGPGLQAVVGLVPGQPVDVPFTVIPQPISISFGCGSSAGGLRLATTIQVAGSTGLFGVSCAVGPFAIPVTATITSPGGSYSDLEGTFTSAAVDLPAVTVSPTCPTAVAGQLDRLVGLPLPGGTLSLPFVASLDQPS